MKQFTFDGYIYECRSCGRQYDFITEEEFQNSNCPEEDCPSHWEEKGIPHPVYTYEGYDYNDLH